MFCCRLTVIASFLFYPFVNILAKKFGKKMLVVGSFFLMSFVFVMVWFLGDALPLGNVAQGYALMIIYAVPLAFLGVLPNAILADIATHDALRTGGKRKKGCILLLTHWRKKFGQTIGVLIFAMLTTFGKDIGDDLGVRLSGVIGFILCFAAGVIFLRYRETTVLEEIAVMEKLSVNSRQ